MRISHALTWLAVMASLPLAVMAGTPPAPAASQSAPPAPSDLAAIQSQTMLYQAEAARRDAQQAAHDGQARAAGAGHQTMTSGRDLPPTSYAPVVMGVYGAGKHVFVRVAMPDGSRVDVAPGARLPGGQWRVTLTATGTALVPVRPAAGGQ